MRLSAIVVLGLFAFFMFAMAVWMGNQSYGSEIAEAQIQLNWLIRSAGLFLAAGGGLVLLIGAVAGDPPGRMLGAVLAVLAGGLLIEPQWGIAIALGLAAAAVALRQWVGGRRSPIPPGPGFAP